MPELPEVETTKSGIAPYIENQTITNVIVRQHQLRWKIPEDFVQTLMGQTIVSVKRRAKYLLIETQTGVLLIHLGMSGSLRIYFPDNVTTAKKHDHVEWHFANGTVMRYHDPRRFGAVLWFAGASEFHPLLEKLGPEPLSTDFDGHYLHQKISTQKRKIKVALMDNAVVVGVGNIYANEALFMSGILPDTACHDLDINQCTILANNIKTVLTAAIAAGGSTLRDFVNSDGTSGYFQQQYHVYGRDNLHCHACKTLIQKQKIAGRSSFYCPNCQQ